MPKQKELKHSVTVQIEVTLLNDFNELRRKQSFSFREAIEKAMRDYLAHYEVKETQK